MPINPTISAQDFEALSPELKAVYRSTATGGYELDLPVGNYMVNQDPAALLNAKNHVETENNNLKAKIRQMEDAERQRQNDLETGELLKKKDFEGLQANWQKQLDEQNERHAAELKSRDDAAAQSFLVQQAEKLAGEISKTSAHLLAPHLQSRMRVKMENGQPVLSVVDEAGNAILGGLEALKKAVVDDPRNKSIITQSSASGGSSPNVQSGGSAVPSKIKTDGKKYSDFSAGELKEIKDSDPDKFNELLAAHQKDRGNPPLGSRVK